MLLSSHNNLVSPNFIAHFSISTYKLSSTPLPSRKHSKPALPISPIKIIEQEKSSPFTSDEINRLKVLKTQIEDSISQKFSESKPIHGVLWNQKHDAKQNKKTISLQALEVLLET